MFKTIYTTRMSGSRKSLERRFERISGKPVKFKRMLVFICVIVILSALVLNTLVMAQITNRSTEYTLDITNNGEVIRFENKPFIEDGNVYVPLRELFTKIGLMETETAKIEQNTDTILINLCEKNLNEDTVVTHSSYAYKIELEKNELVINPAELVSGYTPKEALSVKEPMNNAPVIVNGVIYIPFEYAERMVERADLGLLSPPDRYKLAVIYSGGTLSIEYPIEGYYEITQTFGKRVHPITGEESFHTGVDFKADEGTPIKAGISGKVTDNGFDEEKGNYVVIQNESGVEILYSHLSQITRRDVYDVEKYDIVGKVGNTGMSTGSHLHMEVKINGEYVNPEMYLEESIYDKLLVTVNRTILNVLENDGYTEPDYKIIDVEYNLETITPSAVVEVQLKNYDGKIVSVLYSYYESMSKWYVSGIVPEEVAEMMLN